MIDLKTAPFFLDDESIQWVSDTLKDMSEKEKIGQLFCPLGFFDTAKAIRHFTEELEIGGIMFRPKPAKKLLATYRKLQSASKIPLLCAANLEDGGSGATPDGTHFSMPLGTSAADDDKMGYYLGKIAASEGSAVGCNWAFAPIVDIDNNFRNPITNLRTFGADYKKVIRMAQGYLRAAKEENVAVSIKHFPGDGVDERDQHLLTSVNSLSAEEWELTYGEIYRTLIADGAQTVMVGHIAQPEWVKKINPMASPEVCYRPASQSKELLFGLLRDHLGFNGLIVTDASAMLGFACAAPREQAVPLAIANGCDMFLFNKNLDEDYNFMTQGVQNGTITQERLNEAVTRLLATKAALGLHKRKQSGTLIPTAEQSAAILKCSKHLKWTAECADRAITLVKDTQNLLPIMPSKTKRIYLNVLENRPEKNSALAMDLKTRLQKEGFVVTIRNRTLDLDFKKAMKGMITPSTIKLLRECLAGVGTFKNKYDLVIVVANLETQSNASVVRLNWKVIMGMGDDAPWYTSEVPTMFISLANPYHLLDAPMMKTFINAYTNTEFTRDALIEKIMGRSKFKGISPIDPFCGKEDTKL
ncbi:MAG: glycoside hydrolase family 3 protein [Clostridiales Family XIII bacterium]|nr:glycoside hydrolase family 3 protein [Clostridiales Family XIII bacterium]